MDTIREVLMNRDGLSAEEADRLFKEAADEFENRLDRGEDMTDFCIEVFGLEEDYIFEIIDYISSNTLK